MGTVPKLLTDVAIEQIWISRNRNTSENKPQKITSTPHWASRKFLLSKRIDQIQDTAQKKLFRKLFFLPNSFTVSHHSVFLFPLPPTNSIRTSKKHFAGLQWIQSVLLTRIKQPTLQSLAGVTMSIRSVMKKETIYGKQGCADKSLYTIQKQKEN